MTRLRDLISFDVPEEVVDAIRNELTRRGLSGLSLERELTEQLDSIELAPEIRRYIRESLRELYATPEGRAMIQDAADNSPDGRIHFLEGPKTGAGIGSAGTHFVAISPSDSDTRYFSPATGEYHDISMQRMLHHEIYHLNQFDHIDRYSFPEGLGYSPDMEAEAIIATNTFMHEYYDEPPRTDDYTIRGGDGSPGFDISDDFKFDHPELISRWARMTSEELLERLPISSSETMSPETESLIELGRLVASAEARITGLYDRELGEATSRYNHALASFRAQHQALIADGNMREVLREIRRLPETPDEIDISAFAPPEAGPGEYGDPGFSSSGADGSGTDAPTTSFSGSMSGGYSFSM